MKVLFRTSSSTLLSVLYLSLVACGGDGSSSDEESSSIDRAEIMSLVTSAGLTGDPTTGRILPSVTDAKVQLGKKLFFTKGLAGDSDSACVACHHPTMGGGDNLSLSIGVGAENPDLLGVGRMHDINAVGGEFDGGPPVPRNAPTTFNMALWDQTIFHDGRIESLGKTPGVNGADGMGIRTPDSVFGVADPNAGENLTIAQARFPVTSHEEMRGFTNLLGTNDDVRSALEVKLAGDWDEEFAAAFGDSTITYARISEALAEYERSQIFVDTPWKAYVEGDNEAISESAKRGALLFFNTIEDGGANCVSCHSSDFFTDEKFHVTAAPQIGRGKGNDNGVNTHDDFGRFRETGNIEDMYKFRTPTLLNVEVTGPWGHAGGFTSLEATIRHKFNPAQGIDEYDFLQLNPSIQASNMLTNTQFALDQLEANRNANVENVLRDVDFDDEDVTDMVEFMKALTDPCVKDRDCLSPWIPDASDTNPDGLRLNAIDNTGSYL